MKYKYDIGQSVYYKTIDVIEETCPCCEHTETTYETVERYGQITSRSRDYALGGEEPADFSEELYVDGRVLMIPKLSPIGVPRKNNFYKINGENVIEGNIWNDRP